MDISKKIRMLLLASASCLCVTAAANTTYAATKNGNGVYSLKTYESDSFTKADVTGDGRPDKIETVATEKNGTIKTALKVNGRQMKFWTVHQNNETVILPSVSVVVLSKKVAYLEITTEDYRSYKTACALYQVKKGKLQTAFNYEKMINNKLLLDNDFVYKGYGYDMVSAAKVSKNTIHLNVSLGTKSLGHMRTEGLKLKYSGGKLALQKDAGKIVKVDILEKNYPSKTFTAAKKIQTVKAAGSTKKGIVLPKKTKFTAKKLAITGKNIYVQVQTTAGKTGWIDLSASDKPLVTTRSIVIWG